MVGGIPVGALGGYWFGLLPTVPIAAPLLLAGALFGSLVLCVALLIYDSVGTWPRLFYSCLIPVGLTVLLGVAATRIFVLFGIDDNWFARWIDWQSAASGGARLGIIVGTAMGLQIGATLLVYTRWQRQATAVQ
jgi:hypothetical protein